MGICNVHTFILFEMDVAQNYMNGFPPTIPTVLVHKILNMRPCHPVAELVAKETLEVMHQELTNFYIDGGGGACGTPVPESISMFQ